MSAVLKNEEMMDSDDVFFVIDQIARISSKNEKQSTLAMYKEDTTLQKVLNFALNPFINFGMQQMPETVVEGYKGLFDEATWDILDRLANRQLTGNEAKAVVSAELGNLSPQSAELFTRILRKDLRAGFSESTVNKVIKGFIPEFPYMRCCLPKDAKMDEWNWDNGVFSQEKADGMFANINYDAYGVVTITTRQGTPLDISKFQSLEAEIKAKLPFGTQTHGEFLVVVDGKIASRQTGNGIMNHIIDGGDFALNETPILKVWDQIPLTSVIKKGKYGIAYCHRVKELFAQLPSNTLKAVEGGFPLLSVIETRVVRSRKQAFEHFKELLLDGKEGTIVKNPSGEWADGTSKNQVKLKLEFVVDLKVKDIILGEEGKNTHNRPAALNCETSDGLLKVNVTVKNEDMRNRVEANPEEWIDSIISVVANDVTLPSESNEFHSLFLPRMVEADYRRDKDTADSLAQVFAQLEAAKDAV